jgi:two-component system LytT family response regulator
MNIIIVDDEIHVQEAISRMITLYYPQARVTGVFNSIKKATEAIHAGNPDVLLLDIEMGKERGFDILNYFPKPSFKVIFITAYQQYAIDAFRFAALDYLLKPVDPDLLVNALDKAADMIDLQNIAVKMDLFMHNMTSTTRSNKKIVLKTASDIHVVNIMDIMYCEADHSYTTFHFADKNRIVVSTTLGYYEELLKDFGFFRIHQSYLLNMHYLSHYEKGEGGNVILKNSTSLPVATRKKEQFLQQLSRL